MSLAVSVSVDQPLVGWVNTYTAPCLRLEPTVAKGAPPTATPPEIPGELNRTAPPGAVRLSEATSRAVRTSGSAANADPTDSMKASHNTTSIIVRDRATRFRMR